MQFNIYRYNPERDARPFMQVYEIDINPQGAKLLDALTAIKEQDESLSFRRSCREGVCGSDGVNVNGRNVLACVTTLEGLKEPITIRPLPRLAVIRDLIVDMEQFYQHYRAVKPYLINVDPEPENERLQTATERAMLDGLWECVLCGCCTTACPAFWWNPDRFLGPAALLQSARFLLDSRDQATDTRLDFLEDPYRLFRCHGIMSCVESCPKGLNPTAAIGRIKHLLVDRAI